MNKSEYLKLKGYSETEWIVLDNVEATAYLDCPGHVSNMFEIDERKAVAQLGKGNYLTNIKWMEKYTEVTRTEAPEELKAAADLIDEAIPSSVPAAPVIPKVPTAPKVEDNFECEKFNQTATSDCVVQCDSCKPLKEALEITEEKRNEINEEDQILIRLNVRLQRIIEVDTCVLEGEYYVCSSGIRIGKAILSNSTDKEFEQYMVTFKDAIAKRNVTDQIKEIVKESGVPIDKVIVGGALSVEQDSDNDIVKELYNPNYKGVEAMKKKQEEIAADSGVEAEEVEEVLEELKDMDVEKAKGLITPVLTGDVKIKPLTKKVDPNPVAEQVKKSNATTKTQKVAEEKTVTKVEKEVIVVGNDIQQENFDFLDKVIHTATEYKKTIYAITLIKNHLACDDLTPEKKIALIEKTIHNIK